LHRQRFLGDQNGGGTPLQFVGQTFDIRSSDAGDGIPAQRRFYEFSIFADRREH